MVNSQCNDGQLLGQLPPASARCQQPCPAGTCPPRLALLQCTISLLTHTCTVACVWLCLFSSWKVAPYPHCMFSRDPLPPNLPQHILMLLQSTSVRGESPTGNIMLWSSHCISHHEPLSDWKVSSFLILSETLTVHLSCFCVL